MVTNSSRTESVSPALAASTTRAQVERMSTVHTACPGPTNPHSTPATTISVSIMAMLEGNRIAKTAAGP